MAKKRTGPSPRRESDHTKAERDARVADMMDRAKHRLDDADPSSKSANEKKRAEIARGRESADATSCHNESVTDRGWWRTRYF